MTIGERLKIARENAGFTLEELGKMCGTTKQTIYKYENGVITNIPIDRLERIASALNVSAAYLIGWDQPLPDNVIPVPKMRRIPLLDSVVHDPPVISEEHYIGEIDIPDSICADFALRCKEDSMINARICTGDICYIRKQSTVLDGQVAAVLIGKEAVLKRVRLYSDHIVLESDNPQYRPLCFWDDEMKNVSILGLAVAFTGAVK